MRWLWIMLIFVPISILMYLLKVSPNLMFIASCLAIIPLAGVLGHATEELSKYRGQAIGGLLNATFGNATELIIAIVAVFAGEVEVVRASLIGSIIGNLLLVLGLSVLLGGLRFKVQTFSKFAAGTHGSMMTIAVISLFVPALFVRNAPHLVEHTTRIRDLSLWVAGVLIVLYVGSLIFSLVTHESLLRGDSEPGDETDSDPPEMKQSTAFLILFAATVFIAIESEFLVHSLTPVVEQWHLSKLFMGIIIIPIIGNAAEHSTAVVTAIRNKMDISVNIAVSSATQIAMFIGPLIIFVSQLTRHPVTIVFSTIELVAVASAVIIAGQVTRDGKSNWLEGVQLLAAYIIIALTFYFIS